MEEQKLLRRKRKAMDEGNKVAVTNACIDLADMYFHDSQYEFAIREYKTLADLYKERNSMLDYARANRMIGESYTHLREYEKALSYQLIYLDFARKEGDRLEEQRALATIGHTYLTSYLEPVNNPDKATLNLAYKYFMKSLVVCESLNSVGKREHMDMSARLFSNLGVVQECLGNFEKGIELIQKSINICKTHDIFEQLERGYSSLASLYTKNGNYSKAINNYNLAIEVAKRLENKSNLMAASFLSKSDILIKLADFHSAKMVLLKAFKLKSTNLENHKQIETNLKIVAAMCYAEDSLITTNDSDYKAKKLLYEKLGDGSCLLKIFPKALEYYQKMLESVMKTGNRKDLSPCYISLAQTYRDNQDYDLAIEYFYKDFEICKDNIKESLTTLLNIAETLEMANKSMSEVEEVYKKAIEHSQKSNDTNLKGKTISQYIEFLKKNNKPEQVKTLKAELASLKITSSDSESEGSEGENTPNIGDDICIDELTDDSDNSDVERDVDKPRLTRKRTKGFVVKRNNKGETQLHTACINGNATLVRRLLDQGHTVNIRDYCGWLPIHEACICGHLEIVQMLLDKGASINDRGGTLCNGMTPLHDAASNGHLDVIELLLDKGASAFSKTDDGETSLHILKNWRRSVDLNDTETSKYENLLARMKQSIEKAGHKNDTFSPNKENIALIYDRNSTTKNRRKSSPTRIPKKSQSEVLRGKDNLRRYVEKSDSDSESNQSLESVNRYNKSPSPSSSDEDASKEYKKVMENLRTRTADHPTKKRKLHKQPALISVEDNAIDDWLEDDIGVKAQKRRCANPLYSNNLKKTHQEPHSSSHPSPKKSNSDLNALLGEIDMYDYDFCTELESSNDKSNIKSRKKQVSLVKAGFTRQISSSPTGFLSSSLSQSKKRKQQTKLTDFAQVKDIVEADSTSVISNAQKNNSSLCRTAFSTQIPETMVGIDVRIEGRLYRVPISVSNINTLTIKWLADEAALRFSRKECITPSLELETKNGAILAEDDFISILFSYGTMQAEEVLAKIIKWNIPPLTERYKENCKQMSIGLNETVCQLLEECTSTLDVSNLGLRSNLQPLCKAINRQQNLYTLNLSGNYLTNECIQLLCQSLPSLEVLAELDLSLNHINSVSLKCLADTISSNSILQKLTSLNLNHNPLSNNSIKYIYIICRKLQLKRLFLKDVDFTENLFHDVSSNEPDPKLHTLEHLDISSNKIDKGDIIKFISFLNFSRITFLDVSSNNAKEDGLVAEISQNILKCQDGQLRINYLNFSRCQVNDIDVYELLRAFENVEEILNLNLSFNDNITAISLRRLLQHSNLISNLNLCGCQNILKYFEECTTSTWNFIEIGGTKLNELKISLNYKDHKAECDILINMWKEKHGDTSEVFTDLSNFIKLSVQDN